ncbi:MAG: Tetracycline resistance protein, class C [Microgenomates bacterium OLB22]|nr:MAG: Tetracycline resistance protein, class C [Microgenomates bacterium OLB22]
MRKDLLSVLFLSFVNMLNFSVLFPVLPFIVKAYHGSPVVYGILISIYSLFQFLGTPYLGALSDRYGRKPVLLISYAGTVGSWVLFGLAYFLPTEFIGPLALPLLMIGFSRLVDGVTGGNSAVAFAYMSDITPPAERSKVYGLSGAAMGLAILIGPAIGSLTSSTSYGYVGTAIAAGCISLGTMIWVAFSLRESFPEEKRTRHIEWNPFAHMNILEKIKSYQGRNNINTLFLTRWLFGIVFSGYTAIAILFIIDRFNFGQNQLGWFLLFLGSFLIFNQGVMVRRFVERFGTVKSLLIGLFCIGLGLFFIITTRSLVVYILYYYILNLGFSLTMPTFKALLSSAVSESKQGEVMGIDESIMALTAAISPTLSGALYEVFGGLVFWVMSGIVLTSLYLLKDLSSAEKT